MSLPTPERQVSPTPRCGKEVPGSGLLSYHCSLAQTHHYNGPEDDREPCYAVESDRSARAWGAWRQRQDAREAEPRGIPQPVIECPACGNISLFIDYAAKKGNCTSCGQEVPFQRDPEEHPTPPEPAKAPIEWDGFKQITDPTRCPECNLRVHVNSEVFDALEEDEVVLMPCCGLMAHAGWLRDQFSVQTVRKVWDEHIGSAPTKQREGDQQLPDGGADCVQDRIIADMEESKRVGIERYGSVLKTFNGRRSFQDVHDEVRDLFVYLTQIRMEAEASREALIGVVGEALQQERRRWLAEIADDPDRWHDKTEQGPDTQRLAEITVDRVMGYVVGRLAEAVKPE